MEKIMINVNIVFLGKDMNFKFPNEMIVKDALNLMNSLISEELGIHKIDNVEEKNLVSIRLGKVLDNDKSFYDNEIINNDRLLLI